MSEVRLWRHNYDTDFRARHLMLSDDDAQRVGITPYIALPAAEFEAWRRVMLAARCWRDTVIFPNEENGSEVDLCAAVDALPSARKEQS